MEHSTNPPGPDYPQDHPESEQQQDIPNKFQSWSTIYVPKERKTACCWWCFRPLIPAFFRKRHPNLLGIKVNLNFKYSTIIIRDDKQKNISQKPKELRMTERKKREKENGEKVKRKQEPVQ